MKRIEQPIDMGWHVQRGFFSARPWSYSDETYDLVELAEEGTYVHRIRERWWTLGLIFVRHNRLLGTSFDPWPEGVRKIEFREVPPCEFCGKPSRGTSILAESPYDVRISCGRDGCGIRFVEED